MTSEILAAVGTILAISGSTLSIIGTLINNCLLDHHLAMKIWGISNPLLMIWAIGFLVDLWNGSLSVAALLVMYLIFTVTNWYGLLLKSK